MSKLINKYRRHLAFFFLINIVAEILMPSVSLALTSGPSQPEVESFKPIDVADMVNDFTGDFSYNLPLLDVDGYPVNLSYGGGSGMDQEATCVGLGWNINTGSISRGLRGIPDDFNGDDVTKEFNIKDNETYGVTLGVGIELAGTDAIKLNYSLGITYNNYTGYNATQKFGFSVGLGDNATVGLSVGSSGDGLTLSPNVSLSSKSKDDDSKGASGSVSLGTSFNCRTGMKEISLSASISTNKTEKVGKPPKKPKNKELIGNSSSIGFGSPTWVPQITMPFKTRSLFGSFKLGGTAFSLDASADIAANYSKQSLATKQVTSPAYGYLNLQNGQGSDAAMLDFNREKDANFSAATTNLPIPNLTYDSYSVMGQGVGGSYRPYRSDFGYVFDVRATTTSESDALSLDVGLGNTVDAGIDFINTSVNGSSGKWSSENDALSVTQFRSSNGSAHYEPAYFKEQGEMNVDDDGMYAALGKEKAMRFNVTNYGSSAGLSSSIIDENSNAVNINATNNYRSKLVKRNQHLSYLTIADAKKFGLQPSLYTVSPKDHLIGEITTTKTDGTRYVYGLPIYNKLQREASFNVGDVIAGSNLDEATNLISYTSADNTVSNTKGTDHFFSATTTTDYAYGYMLTAVLSADYVDRTANGPTSDDYGTYTLFNYKSTDLVSDYKWRTPFPQLGASFIGNFDEGALTDDQDGKASYVYGVKDIQYLSSIETKNNVAIFEYSNRNDGAGVSGEDGARSSSKLQKKLDKITLYSKPDYDLMVAPSSTHQAFIIKQVHFEYDYTLCKGVYNNINNSLSAPIAEGKLTLKQIYFTYGKSFKGKLSPYRFNYNTTVKTGSAPTATATVNYNPGSVDRWGTYKPNSLDLPNSKYPYTTQDKPYVDTYAALWNLKSIQLPSGGIINIDIESDDYAYIQDKRAGQMFKIEGAIEHTKNPLSQIDFGTMNDKLYDDPTQPGLSRNILVFKLQDPSINMSEYFQDVDKLYFRFLVNVNQQVAAGNDDLTLNEKADHTLANGYEFVNGYADIDSYGTCYDQNYGYVKLKLVQGEKNGILVQTKENPIAKAAWQYARLRTPRIAYNEADPTGDEEGIIRSLANSSFLQNTIQFFQGPNGALKENSLGQDFVVGKSWIRLSNPNKKKLGGGYRVKSVRISDKWNTMLSSTLGAVVPATEYGQNYFYDTNGDATGTSEGVAAYEPSVGADENSFRQPIFMEEHKEQALLAPDNGLFIEAPLGESFFPSPTVGYAKVTVKSINSGTGKTVSEFYTAKDFPSIVHSIGIDGTHLKPNPIFKLFSFSGYDKFTGSQGYSIEINDMHGKEKASHSYEEGASAATKSTFHHYKSSGKKLVNEVDAIKKTGYITHTQQVGIDYDMYADFRENKTTTEAIGVKGDLYFFFIGVIPIPLPPILPSYHKEETELRTSVINKVIYRYGIIDRVDNIENSNISSTENLLWDGETGEVLLTSTTTEFKDPIYAMKYPAHWSYGAAAGSYLNTGFVVNSPASKVDGTGKITDADCLANLYPGDELAVYSSTGSTFKGWVYKSGSNLYFMDKDGNIPVSSNFTSGNITQLKVIRSGHRNLQSLNVGATTTFTNPVTSTTAYFPILNQNYGVLNATAIQMGESWQTFCQCDNNINSSGQYNPYLLGTRGNLRKTKEYTYLALRKQEKTNSNSNIRVDGTFSKFTPFWMASGGNDWSPNPNGWTWSNEATLISPFGNEHENKDALLRYSAAQFGYIQTKPVAITSNSRYKQSANENFENTANCVDDHFGFQQFNANTLVPAGMSHTGKKSIKVGAGQSLELTKQLLTCPQ